MIEDKVTIHNDIIELHDAFQARAKSVIAGLRVLVWFVLASIAVMVGLETQRTDNWAPLIVVNVNSQFGEGGE